MKSFRDYLNEKDENFEFDDNEKLKIKLPVYGLVRVAFDGKEYNFLTEKGDKLTLKVIDSEVKFEKGNKQLSNKLLIDIVNELWLNKVIKAR